MSKFVYRIFQYVQQLQGTFTSGGGQMPLIACSMWINAVDFMSENESWFYENQPSLCDDSNWLIKLTHPQINSENVPYL